MGCSRSRYVWLFNWALAVQYAPERKRVLLYRSYVWHFCGGVRAKERTGPNRRVPVTDIYYGICWFATILSIALLTIGLWNAALLPSEKGFYAFAFLLGIFGAIAVQKNTRDNQELPKKG